MRPGSWRCRAIVVSLLALSVAGTAAADTAVMNRDIAEVQLESAQVALDHGNAARAEELARRASEIDPTYSDPAYLVAEIAADDQMRTRESIDQKILKHY